MNTQKHDGWYSEETWLLALWIDNDRTSYEYWQSVANETLKMTQEGSERLKEAKQTLADRLRDEICDAAPAENKGVFADLLSHALMQVEWCEIADHLLAEPVLNEEEQRETWNGPRPGPKAEPKFPIGRVVSTPGALEAIDSCEIMSALARHHRGDWGDCCPEDWESNDTALINGDRLLSVYHGSRNVEFWIITEHDRSVTTILLPCEY